MNAVHKIFNIALAVWIMTFGSLISPSSAHAQDRKIDLQEAKSIVMEIPEVKAWYERKRAEAKIVQGQGVPAAAGVHTARRMVKDQVYWAVSLIENPTTDPTKWAVFLVRAKDGQITVENDTGKPKSLNEWQKDDALTKN